MHVENGNTYVPWHSGIALLHYAIWRLLLYILLLASQRYYCRWVSGRELFQNVPTSYRRYIGVFVSHAIAKVRYDAGNWAYTMPVSVLFSSSTSRIVFNRSVRAIIDYSQSAKDARPRIWHMHMAGATGGGVDLIR